MIQNDSLHRCYSLLLIEAVTHITPITGVICYYSRSMVGTGGLEGGSQQGLQILRFEILHHAF